MNTGSSPFTKITNILLLFGFTCLLSRQGQAQEKPGNFDAQWKKVDSLLEKKGLYQTALADVDKIYQQAKQQKNEPQTLKALIYRLRLQGVGKDQPAQLNVDYLQKEITTASQPAKSILQNALANLYWTYFQQNRWQIYQRTPTTGGNSSIGRSAGKPMITGRPSSNMGIMGGKVRNNQTTTIQANSSPAIGTRAITSPTDGADQTGKEGQGNKKPADITTWSTEDFHQAISSLFLESLKETTLLQKTRVENYNAIINQGNARYLRPTLFDLLAQNALEYFSNDERNIQKPANAFELEDPAVFADAPIFAAYPFATRDSSSLQYKALLIYQQLIRLHLQDQRPDALVDADIARLQFAENKAVMADKDDLYMQALTKITAKYGYGRIASRAAYLQAEKLMNKAAQYDPPKDTTNRYAKVQAKAICEKVLAAGSDSSEGKDQCAILLNQIKETSINLQLETVNLPQQPFRCLVSWRNASQLQLRLIALTKNQKDNLGNNEYAGEYWTRLLQLPVLKTFNQALPETGDYQTHRTEIRIDALPVGYYALVAGTDKDFSSNKNPVVLHYFQVSAISWINFGTNYFVLNRETGQPIAQATVQIWKSTYDAKQRKYVDSKDATYETDSHGAFQMKEVKKDDNFPRRLEITTSNDHVLQENQSTYYYRRYADDVDEITDKTLYEKNNQQTFLFSDRSIYRPGQTLYFKGIVTTRDAETKQSKILSDFKTRIYLYDANGGKVDSLNLSTNSFGSYHGVFQLPSNLLNGSFKIADDSTGSELAFSVEEYKRPTFYVAFDPVKESYQLGDTIRINGSASAYAGNAVDGATVRYRVVRQARFPYPWLFYGRGGFPGSSQEIAHGEARTDAGGKFTISFAALPDRSVNKDLDPVFDYAVSADVTDAGGETRSGSSSVSTGYKSTLLAIQIPGGENQSADSLRKLTVKASNLSGQQLPANISVSIYPLQGPNRLIRPRLWTEPDIQVLSEKEYLASFPHDEYGHESQKDSWARSASAYNRTDSTGTFLLDRKLTPGWYLVEATTKDKSGAEVKDRQYVALYDSKTGQPASPQYVWNGAEEARTVEPGQRAEIRIGSSASNLNIIRTTDGRPGSNNIFDYLRLDKESKTSTLPIMEGDRGGFAVADIFVKDGRVFTHLTQVNVPWTNKELNISYGTYRDKTLPGSKETWQVHISGYKTDRVAAEMLTTMYDASLDQFKPQEWQIPGLNRQYSPSWQWEWQSNFLAGWSVLHPMYFPEISNGHAVIYDRLIYGDYMGNMTSGYYDRSNMTVRGVLQGRVAGLQVDAALAAPKMEAVYDKFTIRGNASLNGGTAALYVVDGVVMSSADAQKLLGNPNDIQSINVLKGADATALYGSQAANGVIVVTTKGGAGNSPGQTVQVRKDMKETAFFLPDLQTDEAGNISFSFVAPEALTSWKWMSLAHTKDLSFGYGEKTIVTQKQLMVQPNAPRFLREGDRIELSTRIINMTDTELTGQVSLELTDPTNGKTADGLFSNRQPYQYFTVGPKQSTVVSFPIDVPYQYNRPLNYRIVATAPLRKESAQHATMGNQDQGSGSQGNTQGNTAQGNQGQGNGANGNAGQVAAGNVPSFSDGEEATIPVVSNRMLVTETLPLNMSGDGTKSFKFDKLLQSGNSETLNNHALTVEFTTNPAWYAVQALPYLMEYPYECAEQVFNRFYANALAAKIVASSPRIKAIFEQWKNTDTAALLSNLQKNQELKSVLLEETPWVLQAKTESQQKKNIALLFDEARLAKELQSAIQQLKDMQLSNGGFVWFKGGSDDRYITQYILTGIGHLQQLKAIPGQSAAAVKEIIAIAIPYLDQRIKEDYNDEKGTNKPGQPRPLKGAGKTGIISGPIKWLAPLPVQYLYMRSFFPAYGIPGDVLPAVTYYRNKIKTSWLQQSVYLQGMTALALFRTGEVQTAKDIIASLRQTAIHNDQQGMYWQNNTRGYFWYQAPIETQSLLIEAFREITKDGAADREMKTWLLRQKQTQDWRTTKATAEACYALLSGTNDWLGQDRQVQIRLGDRIISSAGNSAGAMNGQETGSKVSGGNVAGGNVSGGNVSGGNVSAANGNPVAGEAGTGYFKEVIDGPFVKPAMGNVTVTLNSAKGAATSPAWGAIYWQYFDNLDQITTAEGSKAPLRLIKELYIEKNTDKGPVLEPLADKGVLHVGDKVKVRIVIHADQTMEYVHMKDMRASCMEPVNVLSTYKWQDGLGYYESTRDASTNFFFNVLPKGTYVFEYPLFVSQNGNFSNGVTSIECMYAPEFASHTEGIRVSVEQQTP